MSNSFNKEEVVAFEDVLEKFNDQLILSKLVKKYNIPDLQAERANNTVWRPQPYIAQSHDGIDASANFDDATQLSVPATLGYQKHSTVLLNDLELRDALQENRLGIAAAQKLASDINLAVTAVICNQSTLVVKRTTAATGYDDVALADSIMNEQGIEAFGRKLALNSRDYNGMASNLAARQTMTGKPTNAYENSYVGVVAGFDTYKLDYSSRLLAATGVTVTINGSNQYYTPVAMTTATTGETSLKDNRYQNIILGVSSGTVRVGDAFTIAGVNAIHHITKQDTGQLKTFRIIAQVSGTVAGAAGTYTISPPIISGQGGTDAEIAYQNVTATPATGAAIVFLNTATAQVNPFWLEDSIELLPGRYANKNPDSGLVKSGLTDNGIQLTMEKYRVGDQKKWKYRWDIFFGVVLLQPEMSGIMLFNQI